MSHVFHFLGQGFVNREIGQAALYLEDGPGGKAEPAPDREWLRRAGRADPTASLGRFFPPASRRRPRTVAHSLEWHPPSSAPGPVRKLAFNILGSSQTVEGDTSGDLTPGPPVRATGRSEVVRGRTRTRPPSPCLPPTLAAGTRSDPPLSPEWGIVWRAPSKYHRPAPRE